MPIPIELDDISVVLDKFDTMFNNHPLLMSLSFPESGKLIQVNQSFLNILGFTREEVIGKTSRELQLFSDITQRMYMVEQIVSKGMVHNYEIQVRKKDGSLMEGLFFGIMVKIKDEKVLFMVMSDLTEQKKLEHIIEQQKNLQKQILDAIPDLIFYKNRKKEYIGANKAFLEAHKVKEEDLKGMTDFELYHEKDAAAQYESEDDRTLETGLPMQCSCQVQRMDGTIAELETIKTPFYNEKDDIAGLIGVGRDISEHKLIENLLLQAKEEAEAASRLKSQFISKMSHEIKTPLSGIIGFLQILEKTELTSDQSSYVGNIRLSAELLYRVINDILDFAKFESRGVDLEHIPFQLHKAIEDAAIPLTGAISGKNLSFDLYIDASVPEYVIGDPLRIQQVIVNLVTNAIKFTEEGFIYLEITASEPDSIKHDVELQIKITDTGIGMSKEVIDKLFQPFQQADESINRKYGGSGLGLTIVKEIIHAMNGKIWVTSEPGKGSEFTATAFVKVDSEKELETMQWKEMRNHLLDQTMVLVVNSSQNSSQVLRNYLEEFGAVTEWITDAKTALLQIIQEPKSLIYDMIFISDEGKEIAYYDFLAVCRSVSTASEVPIILIKHGNKQSEEPHAYFEFSAKINKPIRRHELFLTILKQVTQDDSQNEGKEESSAKIQKDKGSLTKEMAFRQKHMKKAERQRLLIVDDAPVNNRVLVSALEQDYEIVVATNGYEAIFTAAQLPHPDLILLDIMMPEISGFEVLTQLQENPETKDIPVIFLTAMNDKETEEKALKMGAVDYITKPFHIQTVKVKVNNFMLSQSRMNHFKLTSTIDKLTNISNRRIFEERLHTNLNQARMNGWNLSVLMIDIDFFKKYNDSYGHVQGDECLKKVAAAIQAAMHRKEDFAARWGGEEFTCLLPNTGIEDACLIGERIRKSIIDLNILHEASSINKYLTVSVGVTSISSSDRKSIDEIINQADVALYEAKNLGRNQVMPFMGAEDLHKS